MAIVLNVVALGIVLGLCWVAVSFSSARSRTRLSPLPPPVTGYFERPCDRCEGLGAERGVRGVTPCELCDGSGVQPALHED